MRPQIILYSYYLHIFLDRALNLSWGNLKERLKPSMRIYSISRAGNIIVDHVGLLEIAFSYSSKFQLSRFLFYFGYHSTEKQRWGMWARKQTPGWRGLVWCQLLFALRFRHCSCGTWNDFLKRRSLSRISYGSELYWRGSTFANFFFLLNLFLCRKFWCALRSIFFILLLFLSRFNSSPDW